MLKIAETEVLLLFANVYHFVYPVATEFRPHPAILFHGYPLYYCPLK